MTHPKLCGSLRPRVFAPPFLNPSYSKTLVHSYARILSETNTKLGSPYMRSAVGQSIARTNVYIIAHQKGAQWSARKRPNIEICMPSPEAHLKRRESRVGDRLWSDSQQIRVRVRLFQWSSKTACLWRIGSNQVHVSGYGQVLGSPEQNEPTINSV